jgi:DeoR family fructose operon transcriptional repressor
MLAEERFSRILQMLAEKGAVTVQELTELLDTSESTIRRDLSVLHDRGLLQKVFGGATTLEPLYATRDDPVESRRDLNREEKLRIAKYAAGLIRKNDFLFIDAGTTTDLLIDAIAEREIVCVTNGLQHARKLAQKGCAVHVLGGELKADTDAVVGGAALLELERYNFTKGFFGVNGIHPQNGYSTPDLSEAMVKEKALSRCRERYILSDPSKFYKISPVTFGKIQDAVVVTTRLQDDCFREYTTIRETDRDSSRHDTE